MKYLIRLTVIVFATVPFFAFSAILPNFDVCDPLDKRGCDFVALMELANRIIKFLIILGTSVFSVMFMYAGFLYLTARGNSGQISKAHTVFLDTLIGFVIMLAAWLFVDFILDSLVTSKIEQYRLLGR